MKLLPAIQGASKQRLDIELQERRLVELNGLIVAARGELDALDRQRLQPPSDEETNLRATIADLTIEVAALESRRASALVPLEKRAEEIENTARVLLERETVLARKESDVQHTEEVLLSRLDEVGEREQTLVDSNKRLSVREFTLEAREKDLAKRLDTATKAMQRSLKDIELSQKEIAKQDATLKGREVVVAEREGLVAIKEAGFAAREAKIIDQYESLQRAITETNLKHGTNFKRTEGPK